MKNTRRVKKTKQNIYVKIASTFTFNLKASKLSEKCPGMIDITSTDGSGVI